MTQQLNYILKPAAIGMRGFDSASKISHSVACKFHTDTQEKWDFILRYVDGPYRMNQDEAKGILDSGLGLGLIQCGNFPGWTANAVYGKLRAERYLHSIDKLGIQQSQPWSDIEAVSSNCTARNVADYYNTWHKILMIHNHNPGTYIGSGVPMTGEQLYRMLLTQHYWHGNSWGKNVIPTNVGPRGWQMLQELPIKRFGILIDPDEVCGDVLGGLPLFLWNK